MKNLMTGELKSDDVVLTACIWCANLDFTGLTDYAVKAIIGGVIWLGFRIAADYITGKLRNRNIDKTDKE